MSIKRVANNATYKLRASDTVVAKAWNTMYWKFEFMSLRIWIKRAEKANDPEWVRDLMDTGDDMQSAYWFEKNRGYTW